jgi:replication factor C large subunit
MQWTEKYRPKTLEEVKGQEQSVVKIKDFLKNFPQKKKAILLNGPPGVGKTTIVHVISKQLDAEIFELNASDLRNKDKINEILKPVLEQQSLIKKTKLILIDEVDGISTVDRGGLIELMKLIEETNYPIIATANNAWSRKLAPLRKITTTIELKPIEFQVSKEILIEILKKENKFVKLELLDRIIKASNGDLRAAINDIQSISLLGDQEQVEMHERNKEKDIFHIIKEIFQEKATPEMLGLFDKTDMPIDEIFLWIEENIPKIYKNEELANAIERLSKADLFRGRIYKQQYWRFLVYENILLSYGIAQAKKSEKQGFYKYSKPERILKIWLSNQKNARKKSIAEKYAQKTHVGVNRTMQDFRVITPYLKNPKIQKELKLTEDEIAYVVRY